MTRGKQTTAFALAGAIALASGAYALGTQADDGSAVAAKRSGGSTGLGHWRGGPAPLGSLADRLGVDESDLRAALEDIRGDLRADHDQHRDEFAKELAGALGIDEAKVTAALDKVRPERPGRPRIERPRALASKLAKELGLSAAKVRAALDQQRGRPGSPASLANALGVTEEKLHDAFHAVLGDLRSRMPRPPRHPAFGGLAKELGVTQAQLEAALEKVRGSHEDDVEKRRDEFARALADRLKIDVAKVRDVLDDLRPPAGFGRHRPPGGALQHP